MKHVIRTAAVGGLSALFLAFFFIVLPPSEASKQSLLNLGALEEIIKFGAVIVSAALFGVYAASPIAVAAGFGIVEAGIRLSFQGVLSPLPVAIHVITGICMACFFTLAFKRPTVLGKLACYSFALIIPAAFHLVYNINLVPHIAKIIG